MPAALDAATVLSLQRTAGNAAVTALLNRTAQPRALSRAPANSTPADAPAAPQRHYDFDPAASNTRIGLASRVKRQPKAKAAGFPRPRPPSIASH